MPLAPLGDCAVVLVLEAPPDESVVARVRAIADAIETDLPAGVTDVVPAFATVTVFYDPARIASFASLCAALETRVGPGRGSAGIPAGAMEFEKRAGTDAGAPRLSLFE